ncbi:hypothetical protein Hanom_Chr01g00043601 [Helianthus anomalus]
MKKPKTKFKPTTTEEKERGRRRWPVGLNGHVTSNTSFSGDPLLLRRRSVFSPWL